jgi:hypothetical protein
VNHYTDHDGNPWTINQTRSRLSQDLHADLVAAVNIALAYQAKCERLEAMLENAGDLAHNLQEEGDALRAQVLRLRAELTEAEWAKYYAVQA